MELKNTYKLSVRGKRWIVRAPNGCVLAVCETEAQAQAEAVRPSGTGQRCVGPAHHQNCERPQLRGMKGDPFEREQRRTAKDTRW